MILLSSEDKNIDLNFIKSLGVDYVKLDFCIANKNNNIGTQKNQRQIQSVINGFVSNGFNFSELVVVVSDDISDIFNRDIIHFSNKIGIKTAVLNSGYDIKVNKELGINSNISDVVFHRNNRTYQSALIKKRSSSEHINASSIVEVDIVSSEILSSLDVINNRKLLYIECFDFLEYDFVQHLMDLGYILFDSKKILNNGLALSDIEFHTCIAHCDIELYLEGEDVCIKYKENTTIRGEVDVLFYLENLIKTKSVTTLSNKVDLVVFDRFVVIKRLAELTSVSFKKNNYNTLGIVISKGENLLKTLYWYPNLLGCDNHYIIKSGLEVCDVYARFALTQNTALKALRNKISKSKPILSLENGFVSFPTIAISGDSESLSLIKDESGIYFNGISGSSTEEKIYNTDIQDDIEKTEINNSISLMLEHNITKYNHSTNFSPNIPGSNRKKVLVVDQRYMDKSIEFAGATEESFISMLNDAIDENPYSDIIVKVHPDALTGKVKGHFSESVCQGRKNVYLYSEDVNSVSLLKKMDSIYVVSSQLGFEALLLNKQVNCYGISIYSGWGLTNDRVYIPRRNGKLKNIIDIFNVLYLKDVSYICPINHVKVSFDDYIRSMAKYCKESSLSKFSHPKLEFSIDSFVYDKQFEQYFSIIDSEYELMLKLEMLSQIEFLKVLSKISVHSSMHRILLLKRYLDDKLTTDELESNFFDLQNSNVADELYMRLLEKVRSSKLEVIASDL